MFPFDDLDELLTRRTVLVLETRHQCIDFIESQVLKKWIKIFNEWLCKKDVPHGSVDLPFGIKRKRFIVRKEFRKRLLNGLEDVPNVIVQASPRIHTQDGFLLQNGLDLLNPF